MSAMDFTEFHEKEIEFFYFPAPARGCLGRLALHTGGIKFTDTALSPAAFEELKAQGKVIFGSVPVMTHGSLILAQSQAVASYCAELAGLTAGTAFHRAQDLMIVSTLEDIYATNIKVQTTASIEDKGSHISSMMTKFFTPIENMLPEQGHWFHEGGNSSQ